MTEQEELALYKKALMDWEKPFKSRSYTNSGFCNYFLNKHKLNLYFNFKTRLPKLYMQRRLKKGERHYSFSGMDIIGRQQRVTALKNAIEILENN